MINLKEVLSIFGISLVFAFSITLLETANYFLLTLAFVFIMILINVFAKKLAGNYFELKTEIRIWEFKRWGFKRGQVMKSSFPAGAFFPIFSRLIFFPLNGFIWMGSLIFNAKERIYRAAKRHGFYSFTGISEDHLAYIAAAGIFANLLFAGIAYLVGFSEFAKFSIWFAFFNMIPLSELDGNKIFFGSRVLWSFLATVVLIALGYSLLII